MACALGKRDGRLQLTRSALLVLGLLLSAMSRVSAAAVAPACDASAWQRAFRQYVARYPAAGAADLYKLAHHGIMGSEHAVRDTVPVRAWMTRELAQLAAGTMTRTNPVDDPLIEILPPDGRFVRVHLRPFVARRGDTEALLRAFVATANEARGDTAQFACAEQALRALPDVAISAASRAFIADRRRAGFPAVHHADAYERAYGPAYRVVAARRAAALTAK